MSDPAPPPRFGTGTNEPSPEPTPEPSSERHVVLRTLKRVRAMLVLVPLVAVVLVTASIGASKLWADIPERDDAGPDVTCWDGTVGPESGCGEPRGQRGLRWVFPSFQPKDERCARVEGRGSFRPYDVACTLRFDQRSVTITYAVRTSAQDLVAAVTEAYDTEPLTEADGERLVFRAGDPDADGLYRTTVVYAEHPFAVTVEAPDRRVRDTALDELVTYRPADQVVVRR